MSEQEIIEKITDALDAPGSEDERYIGILSIMVELNGYPLPDTKVKKLAKEMKSHYPTTDSLAEDIVWAADDAVDLACELRLL